MFGKIATLGAMLALLLSVGSVSAKTSQTPSCCATQTRCCAEAKVCCDQPDQATCCQTGTACCDMKDCCGTQKTAAAKSSTFKSAAAKAAKTCPVTGLNRAQCCASKASPMPPCCAQGCDTAGQMLR